MKIIRISKGKTVPLSIRLIVIAIAVFLIVKIVILLPEVLAIILIILLSSLIPTFWFATNIIVINDEEKTIYDGIWAMGKRLGKSERYDALEGIMIEKIKTRETVYTLSNKQNIVANHEFRAYLKTTNGGNYFLLSHPLKERLEVKVTKIKKKLEIN